MEKIILIESNYNSHHDVLIELFKGKLEIISVFSVEYAVETFLRHKDVSVIVLAARIGNRESTDCNLLAGVLKELFKGPIIAISELPNLVKEMIDAGCTDGCSRDRLNTLLLEVLEHERIKKSTPTA
jgi:hypothetical protein